MTITTPQDLSALADDKQPLPGQVVLRDATMAKTQNIPADLDLSKPHNIAKVAMMDNETHPDLIGALQNEMLAGGISPERVAFYADHFLIRSARGKSFLAQTTAINSFLTYALLPAGELAYAARHYVFQMGRTPAIQDFMTLFRHVPLDTLIKYGLPLLPGETFKAPEPVVTPAEAKEIAADAVDAAADAEEPPKAN